LLLFFSGGDGRLGEEVERGATAAAASGGGGGVENLKLTK